MDSLERLGWTRFFLLSSCNSYIFAAVVVVVAAVAAVVAVAVVAAAVVCSCCLLYWLFLSCFNNSSCSWSSWGSPSFLMVTPNCFYTTEQTMNNRISR